MLGYNLFAYCENDPVGMIDITGKYCVANIDDDGNPFDDWLHECAGGGGVKGNYNGPGSSYYTYQVRMGTASYDAHLGGYHSTGMSSAMYNLSYYSVAGAASVSDSMATDGKVNSQLIKKLDYLFGKATGTPHNIDRSTGLLKSLQSIGINDTPSGRSYMLNQLEVIRTTVGLSETSYSSLIYGSGGILNMVTCWSNGVLKTVFIYGKWGQ